MRLDGLKGNESLKRQLAGTAELPQACIIAGPPGSGRHDLVRILAQSMVCAEARPERRPCGMCRACRKAAEDVHPDVIWAEQFAEPGDREVKVAAARALRQDAYIRPNEARRKVYIIDRPMNIPAQNALLKLLEDGPPYAAFLILTENIASLLETVRSRCLHFQTAPAEEQEDPEEVRYWCGRWTEAVCAGQELPLMEWAAALQAEKTERETLEQVYGELYRLLVAALSPARWADPDVTRLARSVARPRLVQLARRAEEARNQCQYNVSVGHSAGWFAVKTQEILAGV